MTEKLAIAKYGNTFKFDPATVTLAEIATAWETLTKDSSDPKFTYLGGNDPKKPWELTKDGGVVSIKELWNDPSAYTDITPIHWGAKSVQAGLSQELLDIYHGGEYATATKSYGVGSTAALLSGVGILTVMWDAHGTKIANVAFNATVSPDGPPSTGVDSFLTFPLAYSFLTAADGKVFHWLGKPFEPSFSPAASATATAGALTGIAIAANGVIDLSKSWVEASTVGGGSGAELQLVSDPAGFAINILKGGTGYPAGPIPLIFHFVGGSGNGKIPSAPPAQIDASATIGLTSSSVDPAKTVWATHGTGYDLNFAWPEFTGSFTTKPEGHFTLGTNGSVNLVMDDLGTGVTAANMVPHRDGGSGNGYGPGKNGGVVIPPTGDTDADLVVSFVYNPPNTTTPRIAAITIGPGGGGSGYPDGAAVPVSIAGRPYYNGTAYYPARATADIVGGVIQSVTLTDAGYYDEADYPNGAVPVATVDRTNPRNINYPEYPTWTYSLASGTDGIGLIHPLTLGHDIPDTTYDLRITHASAGYDDPANDGIFRCFASVVVTGGSIPADDITPTAPGSGFTAPGGANAAIIRLEGQPVPSV
jgi:hypothetical protein